MGYMPPFGGRAKDEMTRSISPASLRSIGITSTPSSGAAASMAANLLAPNKAAKHRHARQSRRHLLEQFKPFPAQAEFDAHEKGGIATRRRKVAT